MKLYGGIDLHSNNSVIHLIDGNDKPVFKKRVNNTYGLYYPYCNPMPRIYRDS